MSDVDQASAGLGRLLRALAALSVLLLALLALVPLREHRAEWRAIQRRYQALAREQGARPISIALREIYRPELGVADRCPSCHLGMGAAAPLSGEPLFAAHPPSPHRVDELGCTVCHRGQGRATTKAAAHGPTAGWADPLLPLPATEAGCGSCHAITNDRLAATAPRLTAGHRLAHQLGCRGCHRIEGVGGDDGPDLSNAGGEGSLRYRDLRAFLRDPESVRPGSRMPGLGPAISDRDVDAVTIYVLSLRQRQLPEALAPQDRLRARFGARDFPTEGAALFGAFCAGCHGPTGSGLRLPGMEATSPAIGGADFLQVADDDLLRRTLLLGRPRRRMPAWRAGAGGLRDSEIDAIIGHLRGLAPTAPSFASVVAAPADAHLGARRYASDCAICHGTGGEGSELGPSLRQDRGVLLERRLYDVLISVKGGTAMGSFCHYDAATLRGMIAHLQELPQREAPPRVPAVAPDPVRGAHRYGAYCASCHGPRGEGGSAMAVATPAYLASVSDGYLAASIVRGRPGGMTPSQMRASEVKDVIAHLRGLGRGGSPRAGAPPSSR